MKNLLLVLVFLAITTSLFSQETREDKQESIKAQKIAFITDQLNLTVEEAQVFWPVYNEFEDKRDALMKNERQCMKKCAPEKIAALSDKEIEAISDEYVNYEADEGVLLKEYHQKFKKVLPVGKVLKLYQAEMEFKHHLLKQIKGGPPSKSK